METEKLTSLICRRSDLAEKVLLLKVSAINFSTNWGVGFLEILFNL
jgi:hypothetical protein